MPMTEHVPGHDHPDAGAAALRWPVAAGVIGVLVVVALGGSWLLTRAARSSATVAVAPAASTARPAAVTSTPLPTARAVTSTATTSAASIATAATLAPTSGTAATGTAGIATRDGGVSGGRTVVVLATAAPTPAPRGWWDASSNVPEAERAEVEQAYARFWEVRKQALLELDADRLTEIMAGPELTAEQQAIKDLQASGRAERVDVEHHQWVTWATSDAATVLDEYVSHTVLVESDTKQPVEDPPSAPFRLAYLFRKVDGRWLAVDAVRVVYTQ